MEIKFNETALIFRHTPWDAKVLGIASNEILSVNISSAEDLNEVFYLFESYCSENEIKFTNIRIPANDKLLKKTLQNFEFKFVESSVLVVRNNAPFIIEKSQLKLKEKIKVVNYETKHKEEILLIASKAFSFGRFAEDPSISEEINQKRNKNWLEDLVANETVKILLFKGEAIGFMAYKLNENMCELILGGVSSNWQHLAPIFWLVVLDEINSTNQIKSYKTLISASNISVFNLYIKLGFSIYNNYWGFSKTRL